MSTNKPICTIVGAGEGLGRSLAKKFASEGFDIALISRSESTAEPILEMIQRENSGVTARFIAADVTDTRSLESAFSKIQTDLGDVSTLLYTARGEFIAYEPLDLQNTSLFLK